MKNKTCKAILAKNLRNYQTELIEVINENTLPDYRQDFLAAAKLMGVVQNELLSEAPAQASFLKSLKEEVEVLLSRTFLPTCKHGLSQSSYALSELLDEC